MTSMPVISASNTSLNGDLGRLVDNTASLLSLLPSQSTSTFNRWGKWGDWGVRPRRSSARLPRSIDNLGNSRPPSSSPKSGYYDG